MTIKTMWGRVLDDPAKVERAVDRFGRASLEVAPGARLALSDAVLALEEWMAAKDILINLTHADLMVRDLARRMVVDDGLDLTIDGDFIGYVGIRLIPLEESVEVSQDQDAFAS